MVWRVDVGMSSGVLNAQPQVCTFTPSTQIHPSAVANSFAVFLQ